MKLMHHPKRARIRANAEAGARLCNGVSAGQRRHHKRVRAKLRHHLRKGEGECAGMPPQDGRHRPKMLPLLKGEYKCKALSNLNEGKGKLDWLPREPLYKDIMSTLLGAAPWDLGVRPPREHIFQSKRPVEIKN
jgi:hypothetical protein